MHVSKNLCLSHDWKVISNNGTRIFRILDEKYIDILDFPVPITLTPPHLDCEHYLLIFKKHPNSSTAEFAWLYNIDKSVLYNNAGELTKMTEVRRFMKLLYNTLRNS